MGHTATSFSTAQSSQSGRSHRSQLTVSVVLWLTSHFSYRTTVEICTAIVAACAPCLKPLVRSVLDSTSHDRSKRAYINYEDDRQGQRGDGPPRSLGRSRTGGWKRGVQLGSLGQVYSGHNGVSGSNESQEMFGRLKEDQHIVKTISVSVQ